MLNKDPMEMLRIYNKTLSEAKSKLPELKDAVANFHRKEYLRSVVLAQLSKENIQSGLAVNKSEVLARADKRYENFINELADIEADAIYKQKEYDLILEELRIIKSIQSLEQSYMKIQ